MEFYLQHKSPFDEEDLQALMPPSLRQESVLQIHKVRIANTGWFVYILCTLLQSKRPLGCNVFTTEAGSFVSLSNRVKLNQLSIFVRVVSSILRYA